MAKNRHAQQVLAAIATGYAPPVGVPCCTFSGAAPDLWHAMETADTIAGPRADRTPAEALAAVQQALKQQRRDGVRLGGFAEMALTLSPADLSGAGIEPHAPPSAKWAKETRAIVAEYYRQRGGYV